MRRNKIFCPVLNLDKLWTLVSEQARLKYANATDGKVPVINIVKAVSIVLFIKVVHFPYNCHFTRHLCMAFYEQNISFDRECQSKVLGIH